MRLQLKTIEEDNCGAPVGFAQLIEPKIEAGQIKTDRELYRAVHRHGSAVLAEYEGQSWYSKPGLTIMGTVTFERTWRGD